METTLIQGEKNIVPKGNHDLLRMALLLFLALTARLLFAGGLAVNYSSVDVKVLRKWDANCDPQNVINWGHETDPGNFVGITWDNSNPKRVIEINISSYDFYNSVNLNDFPLLLEFSANDDLLQSITVANHINIRKLDVGKNKLTSLDVTGCVSLTELYCQANAITNLVLGNATALKTISCGNNQLTEFHLPEGANVKNLDLIGNYLPFSKLPVPGSSYTSYYYEGQMPVFESSEQWLGYTIDYSSEENVAGKPTTFSWYKNKTQVIGANKATYKPTSAGVYVCKMSNTKFPGLQIETKPVTIKVHPNDTNGDGYHDGDAAALNQLRSLFPLIAAGWPEGQHATWAGVTWNESFPKRVRRLLLDNKNIQGTLDLSAFTHLEKLFARNNYFRDLNLSGLTKLNEVDVADGVLQSLDVSGLTSLEVLTCNNNQITQISTSNNNSLKWIYFNNNKVASFNTDLLPALVTFECHHNELTTLDFSKNMKIKAVVCSNNLLTSLIINPSVYQLNCSSNRLSALNLANCNGMEILDISLNKFREIDLSGATILKSFTARWNYIKFSKLPDPALFWESDFINQIQVTPDLNEKIGYVIDLSTEEMVLGSPTVFEWKKNGVTILGATGATLNTKTYGIGNYSCEMKNAKFGFASATTGTYRISKKDQVIGGTMTYNLTYDSVTFQLDNSSSSGLPLTFSSSRESVCTVQGSLCTIKGAGFSYITATQGGNEEYNQVETRISVNVLKASEPILGLETINAKYSEGPFTINAFTPHGLPVTLSSDYIDKVRIEGKVIHVIGVGNSVIRARHNGNDNYNSNEETFYLKVERAEAPILGVENMTFTYGDAPVELRPYTEAGLPVTMRSVSPHIFTLEGNLLTIVGAGTGRIDLTQTGNDYYNAQLKMVDITVNKASQTGISYSNIERAVGDQDIQLPVASEQGFPISYTSSDTRVAIVSGNSISIVGQGESTINASNPGNNNYHPIDENFILRVSAQPKEIQTLSNFDDMEVAATTPSFNLLATASSGLPITYTASNNCIEIEENKAMVRNSGTVFITASQEGSDAYYAAEKTIKVTVYRVAQTISGLNNLSKVINDVPFKLNGSTPAGPGIVYTSSNPGVATVSGDEVVIHSQGETTITATHEGNWQYLPASLQIQLTVLEVTKIADEILSSAKWEYIYGIQTVKTNVGSSSGLPVTLASSDETVVSIIGTDLKVNNAGTCTIYLSTPGNDLYLPAQSHVGVTVHKANQFIRDFSPVNLKVGYTPFTLMAIASSGEPVEYFCKDESIASVIGKVITPIKGGSTQLIAYQAGNRNYNPVADTVEVVVAPRDLFMQTITGLNDLVKSKNDKPFILSGVSSSGLPLTYSSSNHDVATIEENKVTIIGAGITTITATQAGNDEFAPVSVSVQLLITAGSKLTQTADNLTDITATFGDAEIILPLKTSAGLELTYQVEDSKLASVNGNILTIGNAGVTMINATQQGNDLFEPFSWKVKLTVRKKSQFISGISDLKIELGKQSLELSGSASSGLPVTYSSSDPKVVTIEGRSLILHKAGKVVITVSQSGNENYEAAAGFQFNLEVIDQVSADQFESVDPKIYPNPTTGIIKVELEGEGTFIVFDIHGKIVHKENFDGRFYHRINLQQLRKGVYQLFIANKERTYKSKLVIH